ncbi:MAG: hypothetical protein LBL70_00665 [Treponema sp.]|nr:hypothetical protein [Treponema sp.]
MLGTIQFSRQGEFTRQLGNMRISGHYKTEKEDSPVNAEEFPLSGKISVFFGGLEFRLAGDGNGEGILNVNPQVPKRAAIPEYMVISGDTVIFRLSGGGELSFTSRGGENNTELQIRGDFSPDVEGILLSYRPFKTSRVQNGENGLPVITAGGQNYSFSRFIREEGPGLLFLENGGIPVSYQTVPEKPVFNLADYTLAGALNRQSYNALVQAWRDRQYSFWSRFIQGRNEEDLAIAFLGEAVERGSYQSAKALVPSAFLSGNRRGYGSSLYLGGAAQTYPALSTAGRERLNRLSRLIGERSPAILEEEHAFEYIALQGPSDLMSRAVEMVRNIDPAGLSPELAAGVFEGSSDMKRYRPWEEDPFGNLLKQAFLLVSAELGRVSGPWNSDQGLALVFQDGIGNTESNLRLGKALTVWAEETGDEAWAALGRSLILSVLALTDQEGTVPARVSLAGSGAIEEGTDRLDSYRIYRILQPGEYYPRIAPLGIDSIWAWTSSPSVSAVRENGVLDVSVSFPAGETHYLMLWGIQPFVRMQIHSMDWRSDPRYETYDSSGWVYYPRDQLLALKLKHRTQVEHIRIYSSQPSPAVSEAPPLP